MRPKAADYMMYQTQSLNQQVFGNHQNGRAGHDEGVYTPRSHDSQTTVQARRSPGTEFVGTTSSSDLDVRNEKETPAKRSIWTMSSDWFVWEALAMTLSLAFLIAIIVILSRYNNRPQPSWNYMSLNSLVSWLSTFSKGCALFAISETIGQLKWTWLSKQTRPVSHLRTFDSASRGLYGSAELIWSLQSR